jgi:hypothetical protein
MRSLSGADRAFSIVMVKGPERTPLVILTQAKRSGRISTSRFPRTPNRSPPRKNGGIEGPQLSKSRIDRAWWRSLRSAYRLTFEVLQLRASRSLQNDKIKECRADFRMTRRGRCALASSMTSGALRLQKLRGLLAHSFLGLLVA